MNILQQMNYIILPLNRVQDIDLATVYRTLEILESLDLVEHSHQQHGSGIYYLKTKKELLI